MVAGANVVSELIVVVASIALAAGTGDVAAIAVDGCIVGVAAFVAVTMAPESVVVAGATVVAGVLLVVGATVVTRAAVGFVAS